MPDKTLSSFNLPTVVRLDMGTDINEKSTPLTMTASPVADDIRNNRDILITALANYGLTNYPDEWWHFSYGDRLWAEVKGRKQAFFAPIDYDSKSRVNLPQMNDTKY